MEKKACCFVIMPFSDAEGYDKSHFTRVYEHLIKPAVEKAGFTSLRADDKKNTNYIVIDILKSILDSAIVLCDLSSKNANVLYELGIRQAFNKKVVLLKDHKTDRIFDIQGLRYIEYDESLRIDSVKKDIDLIAEGITETYTANEAEINSLIQLLSIKPATISSSLEISNETNLILKAIEGLEYRINTIEAKSSSPLSLKLKSENPKYIINNEEVEIGQALYIDTKEFGKLADVHSDSVFIRDNKNKLIKVFKTDPKYKTLSIFPF